LVVLVQIEAWSADGLRLRDPRQRSCEIAGIEKFLMAPQLPGIED